MSAKTRSRSWTRLPELLALPAPDQPEPVVEVPEPDPEPVIDEPDLVYDEQLGLF